MTEGYNPYAQPEQESGILSKIVTGGSILGVAAAAIAFGGEPLAKQIESLGNSAGDGFWKDTATSVATGLKNASTQLTNLGDSVAKQTTLDKHISGKTAIAIASGLAGSGIGLIGGLASGSGAPAPTPTMPGMVPPAGRGYGV